MWIQKRLDLDQRRMIKKGVHFFYPEILFVFKQYIHHEWICSGTGGFEPPNSGTKTRCLTAWPRPIFDSTLINTIIGIGCSSIPPQKIHRINCCQEFDMRRYRIKLKLLIITQNSIKILYESLISSFFVRRLERF